MTHRQDHVLKDNVGLYIYIYYYYYYIVYGHWRLSFAKNLARWTRQGQELTFVDLAKLKLQTRPCWCQLGQHYKYDQVLSQIIC